MWTRTRATEALGLDVPIVQGPFGGYSTVALVAAVSNAGGLGSFGAVTLLPEAIAETVRAIAERTRRPFAMNLWVPMRGQEGWQVAEADFARAAARLTPYYEELGLPAPDPPDLSGRTFALQVEALLAARPPVFSFVMGVPDAAILRAARARGIKTVGAATTVDEAVALADAGVDAIVASGSDAGGHRGSFLRPVEDSLVGTLALVPQVASAVDRPILAAGGIADGRAIAAALALGADGVQIGTAFLAAPESGVPQAHRALLGTARARATRLTRAFSGRLARGIPNPLMDALEAHAGDLLPFPAQNELTMPLRRAAAAAGRADLLALWAGQAAALVRARPAAELVRELVADTDRVLRSDRLRPL